MRHRILQITWLQGNIPNDDFTTSSRSSRFFTRAYTIDASTAIINNKVMYWYNFMHSTLRLLASCGSGQNHITNKLNFTIAIVFLSVIFFCMIMYISYTRTSISQILFNANLSLVLSNNNRTCGEMSELCTAKSY